MRRTLALEQTGTVWHSWMKAFHVQNPTRQEHWFVIQSRPWTGFTWMFLIKVDRLFNTFGHPCYKGLCAVSQWTRFKGFWQWLHLTVETEDFTSEKRNSELCTQKLSELYQYFSPPRFLSRCSTFLISYRLDFLLSLYCTLSCPFTALWKFTSCPKTNSRAHCMKLHFKRVGPLFHIVWSLHSGLFAPLLHGD
jgi:hypothetical protein